MSTIQEQKKKQLTFEEICPEWSIMLNKGSRYGHGQNGQELIIIDYRYCIVGEAHKFNPGYITDKSKDWCEDCFNYSNTFEGELWRMDSNRPNNFEQIKLEFVEHWNEVHLNK